MQEGTLLRGTTKTIEEQRGMEGWTVFHYNRSGWFDSS